MNLNSTEYTVIGDMIIINWIVNKPIGMIDEKFKKLIFSSHEDIDSCIEQINNYALLNDYTFNKFKKNWRGSYFNQPISLTDSLTHLFFGEYFNCPISLTNSLTHLIFGDMFNQPVILTNSLTHLTFAIFFNQQIILPHSLTHLTIGISFNQSIELANIKYLNINCNNSYLIEK